MPLKLASIREAALYILFPRWCLGYGREGSHICPCCLEKLPRLNAWVSNHLELPLSIYAIHSPFLLEGTVRRPEGKRDAAVHGLTLARGI